LENIKDLSLPELKESVVRLGLKPFVATQLAEWLYRKKATSFDQMTNLSKEARRLLPQHFVLSELVLTQKQEAADGTQKFLFTLSDGKKIEAVWIPTRSRVTVCLSTQVGCAMDCRFCRTGEMGLLRNLTQSEMLDQVLAIQRRIPDPPVTNLVFMGMGEPMANLKALLPALEIFYHDKAFGFSKRKVTVSTSGLVPKMAEFAKVSRAKLAISLHAPNDTLRNELMPINKRYPLRELMQFCRDYQKNSRNWITFEYVMLRGVNDTDPLLKELIALLKEIRAKVNLIPFNPFPDNPYKPSTDATIDRWTEGLFAAGIQTNVRRDRGREILAACGQLAA